MTLKKTDARVELPKLSYVTKFSELLHHPGLPTETQADGPTLGPKKITFGSNLGCAIWDMVGQS